MRIFLESLGCSRNQVDSEIMLGKLLARGHTIAEDPSLAEVIIVNTCGFISTALDEAVDVILEMAEYKKTGACRRLIAAGCLAQRYKDDPDLSSTLPEVDAFLGTAACDNIVEAVENKDIHPMTLFPEPKQRPFYNFSEKRALLNHYYAYVKVSEGCNRKCTYCIIPKLRGTQRSKPLQDIVRECGDLVQRGVKEVILTAENTTDYGLSYDQNRDQDKNRAAGISDKIKDGKDFNQVIKQVAKTLEHNNADSHPAWIRFLYAHPETLTESLIHTVTNHPNICSYYDVPIQHASPKILKKMGRYYKPEELYTLFETIRRIDPTAALRTTLIVGFPGETQADFDILMQFVKDIRFDHLGVFVYSDSDDIKSYTFKDKVPHNTAQICHDQIMEAQNKISLSINEGHIGKIYDVLVEENPEPGLYIGRTMFQAPEVDGVTFIYAEGLETACFVKVKINDAFEYDIAGEPFEVS
jgi:ribosomal protein S12 methylthiotransferase